jgi:inorganic pyrophosphatase
MNIWKDIDKNRVSSTDFVSVIEISKNGRNKYELDKETGMLKLDRILYTSTHYPANYGFIPRTYADDNDPLDVLVLSNEEILPLTLVECYPIGVLIMTDGDSLDEKIIAVPKSDPFFNVYRDISALPAHISEEIRHFFGVYKQLEGKKPTNVDKVYGHEEAEKIIEKALDSFNKKFPEEANK